MSDCVRRLRARDRPPSQADVCQEGIATANRFRGDTFFFFPFTCSFLNQVRKSEAALLAQNSVLQRQVQTLTETVATLERNNKAQETRIDALTQELERNNKAHEARVAQIAQEADRRFQAMSAQFRQQLSETNDVCEVSGALLHRRVQNETDGGIRSKAMT